MYINYYSVAYDTQAQAQEQVDALSEAQIDAITQPFQIMHQTGGDAENPVFESVDGKWYFNARSKQILTGVWIGQTPESPAVEWL